MKRVYVIVLDEPDEGAPEWGFFEDCVKQSALETWDTTGYSHMNFTDVMDQDHPDFEGEFDSANLFEEVGHLVDQGLTYIKECKAEADGEEEEL